MVRTINLLPEQLRKKQKIKRIYFFVNLFSIALLFILSSILLALFSYRHQVTSSLNSLTIEADHVRSQLERLRNNEGLYRYIKIKVTYLGEKLNTRPLYGDKLFRIQEVAKDSISIVDLEMDHEENIVLSGETESFATLANTLLVLTTEENLLHDLELTKLGKEKETGKISFTINGSLREKLSTPVDTEGDSEINIE